MKDINRVWRYVLGRDASITHDGDSGAYLLILTGAFQCKGKGVIRTQLMPHFMHDIIYIEIIPLRNPISRRRDSASFLSVHADTPNTSGIPTAP
jgi:hypothetical protein